MITGAVGDPQFQLMFEIVGLRSTAIEFGTDLAAGEAVILPGGTVGTSNNARVSIVAVPEPGIALLLGFGLAVLRYTRVGSGCRRSVANSQRIAHRNEVLQPALPPRYPITRPFAGNSAHLETRCKRCTQPCSPREMVDD